MPRHLIGIAAALLLLPATVMAMEVKNLDFSELDSAGAPAHWTVGKPGAEMDRVEEKIDGVKTDVLTIAVPASADGEWNMSQKIVEVEKDKKFVLSGRIPATAKNALGVQVKVREGKKEISRADSPKATERWQTVRVPFATAGATEVSIQFRVRAKEACTVKLADFNLVEVES